MLTSQFLIVTLVNAQPVNGNWIVTGTETVENQTIILNGNLTVAEGGSLSLRNVNLIVNCQYSGQYEIVVERGGVMTIETCNIVPSNLDFRYNFIVEGNDFILRETRLQGAGWQRPEDIINWTSLLKPWIRYCSLNIIGNNSFIEGNQISDNFIALMIYGSDSIIRNNSFTKSGHQSIYIDNSCDNITVENNTFDGAATASLISGDGTNLKIVGNTCINSSIANGNWFGGDNLTFCGNTFHGGGLIISSINAIIENNVLLNYVENGLTVISTRNNRIINNTISAGDGALGDYGLNLEYVYDSLVANNSLSAGIFLHNSINNTVVNNDATIGLVVINSKYNRISANNIATRLILYHLSDGNTISNNNFTLPQIIVDNCSNNTFFANNFYNPYGWLNLADNSNNSWNSSQIGNFWNKYAGNDNDGDYVGDTPFYIPTNGIDHYPSTSPFPISPIQLPTFSFISHPQESSDSFPSRNGTYLLVENQILNISNGCDAPEGCTLKIKNCTIFMSGNSFHCWQNGTIIIEDSVIKNTDFGYGYNIDVDPEGTLIIRNSELYGIRRGDLIGIICVNAKDVLIENSILSNMLSSLIFNSPTKIINCTFTGVTTAFGIFNSSIVEIRGNTIHDAMALGFAINGQNNVNVTIADNVIERCWGGGLMIGGLVNDVQIYNNTIMNCQWGIWATGNNLLVYHNNFINTFEPFGGSELNYSLSVDGEGNYWSGFNGVDHNFDGVSETPYVILNSTQSIIVDEHPLMQRNGWETKIPFTVYANMPNVAFTVNATQFLIDSDNSTSLMLGYRTAYEIGFKDVSINMLSTSDNISLVSQSANTLIIMINGSGSINVDLKYSSIESTYLYIIVAVFAMSVACMVMLKKNKQRNLKTSP
jgi:parallel beta-helix repeat protein